VLGSASASCRARACATTLSKAAWWDPIQAAPWSARSASSTAARKTFNRATRTFLELLRQEAALEPPPAQPPRPPAPARRTWERVRFRREMESR